MLHTAYLLWTGDELDHFDPKTHINIQAHKEKATTLQMQKYVSSCGMMHPSIKLPCVHAGLDDWIS